MEERHYDWIILIVSKIKKLLFTKKYKNETYFNVRYSHHLEMFKTTLLDLKLYLDINQISLTNKKKKNERYNKQKKFLAKIAWINFRCFRR